MLTTKNNGGIAGFGPRYMVVAVVGGFHRCPKALEKQHLQLSEASVLRDMRLGDYFAPSNKIAARGVCP